MKTLRLVLFALLPVSSATLFAAGPDENLVARWTFNDPSFFEQNLQSDIGAHKFRRLRFGEGASDCSFDGGSVLIDSGCLLVCDTLSSAATPDLSVAVTIWARLRLETAPKADCFTLGFRSMEDPADWKNMILTMVHYSKSGQEGGYVSRFLDKDTQLTNGRRTHIIEPGRWATVALVFSGAERKVSYIVNGEVISGTHADANTLSTFTNFALGHLKEAGHTPQLTFDEVRVYSVALSPQQVVAIAPVGEPGK